MDVEETTIKQIEELEKALAKERAMLQGIRAMKKKIGDASMRFFDMSPIDAARVVLREHGDKMKRSKVIEAIEAGGVSIGKKRPKVNIRRSFKKISNWGILSRMETI